MEPPPPPQDTKSTTNTPNTVSDAVKKAAVGIGRINETSNEEPMKTDLLREVSTKRRTWNNTEFSNSDRKSMTTPVVHQSVDSPRHSGQETEDPPLNSMEISHEHEEIQDKMSPAAAAATLVQEKQATPRKGEETCSDTKGSLTGVQIDAVFARIFGISESSPSVAEIDEVEAIASKLLRDSKENDDKSTSDGSGTKGSNKEKIKSKKSRGKDKMQAQSTTSKGPKKRSSSSKTDAQERPKRQRKKLQATFDPDDYMDDEAISEILIKNPGEENVDAAEVKKKRNSVVAQKDFQDETESDSARILTKAIEAKEKALGEPATMKKKRNVSASEKFMKKKFEREKPVGEHQAGKKKRYPSPSVQKTDDEEMDMGEHIKNTKVYGNEQLVDALGPVMELGEFLTKSRAEVQAAASLVSRSLAVGLWPSPYRSLEPERIYNRQPSEYIAHNEHMSMVGVAIETFSNDIVSQAIIEDLQHCPQEKRAESRAYLATLLNLREVLILNAATIFGPSALLTGGESDFTVIRTNHDSEIDAQEAAMLTARMLATAVIIDGLTQLGEDSGEKDLAEDLTIAFLDMVEKLGDDEFARCLRPMTDNVIPFYPSRQQVPDAERRVWRSSYNYQRGFHPLISQSRTTEIEPTAVHISMIQSVKVAKED